MDVRWIFRIRTHLKKELMEVLRCAGSFLRQPIANILKQVPLKLFGESPRKQLAVRILKVVFEEDAMLSLLHANCLHQD